MHLYVGDTIAMSIPSLHDFKNRNNIIPDDIDLELHRDTYHYKSY